MNNVCYDFENTGKCKFGNKCKYSHNSKSLAISNKSSSKYFAKAVNEKGSNQAFLSALRNSLQDPKKLPSVILRFKKDWNECWNNLEPKSLKELELLVVVLAKYPFSGNENLQSMSIKSISNALILLVERSVIEFGARSDGLVKPVEIVLDTVKRLLKITWDLERGNVKDHLNAALVEASDVLSVKNKDHRLLQNQIRDLLDQLDKPWGVKYSNPEEPQGDVVSTNEYSGWRNCSIGWLSDLKKFQPNFLPVFKIPDTKYGGVYADSAEYFDTITKVWVAMTFGDGNSIISPHCKNPENGKECGRLLWGSDGDDHGVICRSKGCDAAAVLICSNRFHKNGQCERCAQETRNNLKGPPGPKASSHIYDGVVVKRSFDNRIFIREVKSRKPPKDAIHWKTTSRLKSSNLVGIVVLPSQGSGLSNNDKVIWAEIGFHSDSWSEHTERAQGKLVLTVLKEVFMEKSISIDDTFQLDAGAYVAIIDCQTFAPEFIPVLTALENQRSSYLPLASSLNIGTQLNVPKEISTDPIYESDAESTDDTGAAFTDAAYLEIEFPEYEQVTKRIIQMVDKSNLDPIIKIRRKGNVCSQLVRDLARLVLGAKLDPDQFDSFIGCLEHNVHCTQGPPGTGKSYVGVVMARALLVIRALWMKVNPSAGEPPILILSYKNHAIDEFLLDLIKVEPSLRMIRMGDSPEPKLSSYSEKNASRSLPFVFKSRNGILIHFYSIELNALHGRLEDLRDFFVSMKGFYLEEDELGSGSFDKKLIYKNVDMLAKILSWVNFMDASSQLPLPSGLHLDMMTKNLSVHLVENLYLGFKHYPESMNLSEILLKFLTNFKPSPKCKHSAECESIAEEGFNFCNLHRCYFAYSDGNHCQGSITVGRIYCTDHLCAEEDCDQPRLNIGNQVFCEFHSCWVCLNSGAVALLARGDPPRNTCESHTLCMSQDHHGRICQNIAVVDQTYCLDHEPISCAALTKRGAKCRDRAISKQNPYCSNHQKSIAEILIENNVCSAKTSKGKPCKGKRALDSLYCRDHEDVVPATKSDGISILEKIVKTLDPVINSDMVDTFVYDESKVDPLTVKEIDSSSINTDEYDEVSIGSDIEKESTPDSDIEGDDNYEHLREIFECNEIDDIMKDSNDSEYPLETVAPSDDIGFSDLTLPTSWDWDMPYSRRIHSVRSFINYAISLYPKCFYQLEAEFKKKQKEHHVAITESRSAVYEGKSVIAGTIVGCISRLEVIRGSNPFAIVVEEASEVLEPILFSCIGSSTLKLEMIGDHLQLQPSMSSKFEFEKINKIKCSLFERLIRAREGCRVQHNILSIQRRMRKEISDFTRSFYSHITQIKDDSLVKTRRIGQDLVIRKAKRGPLNVPGIPLDVFFWTHQGSQKKSNVGLSKINIVEAKMVCNLAKYLVDNGVPKQSIAILTPYKGQLMLIRKDLSDNPYKLIDGTNDSIRISTVDRFQGDEADIVIVSLVIDGNSTTPFVKLQNRMIVLLSRARIGMYIVGNASYFEKNQVSHWQKSIELFQVPLIEFADEKIAHSNYLDMEQTRIGPALPICCPVHPNEIKITTDANALAVGFCKSRCQINLVCGHPCDLECHWPSLLHKSKCDRSVISPCRFHPEHNVNCYEFMFKMPSKPVDSIEKARQFYMCPVKESFKLPCSHDILIACAKYQDILADPSLIPVCQEQCLQPFIYQDCKHELYGTCHSINEYINSTVIAPPCNEKCLYISDCGHKIKLECFLKRDLIANPGKFICSEKVEVRLPRCGHNTVVPCRQSRSFASWEGLSCNVADDGILEGQAYGPVDHICKVQSVLRKKCGHEVSMSCEDAFSSSCNILSCSELINITNPTCRHPLRTECKNRSEIEQLLGSNCGQLVNRMTEGANIFVPSKFGRLCRESVHVQRKCGHEEYMACKDAQEIKSKCKKRIEIKSPLCGHFVKVLCDDRRFETAAVWDSATIQIAVLNRFFTDSVMTQSFFVPVGIADKDDLKTTFLSCEDKVTILRDDCKHMLTMDCKSVFKQLLESIDGKLQLPSCDENVSLPLKCNHLVDTTCSEYEKYLNGDQMFSCGMDCEKQCWNFNSCGSYLRMRCSSTELPCCEKLTNWTCPQSKHSFKLNICSSGIPNACPLCYSEMVVRDIEALESLKIHSFSDIALTVPDEIIDFLKQPEVASHKADLNFALDFKNKQIQLLDRFSEKWDDLWSQPLYNPQVIPCFWASKGTFTEINLPKHISSSSLNGINVYSWSKEGFKLYLDNIVSYDHNVDIIFGFGYSAYLLSETVKLPNKPDYRGDSKKNQKERKERGQRYVDQISSWVTDWHVARGYDAVKLSSSESFVFWEPYCICPLIRLKVKKSLALKLLDALPSGKDQSSLIDQKIQFAVPGGLKSSQQVEDNIHLARKALSHLKIPVSKDWNGQALFLNYLGNPFIERDLFNKLKFSDPRGKRNNHMFAGLTFLDNLEKNGSIFPEPEFDLIRCLELLSYDRFKEAKKYFNGYCKKAILLHPLVLVAMARGAEKKQSENERKSLLTTFSKIYPQAKDKWLTVEEIKLMDDAVLVVSGKNQAKSDSDLSPKEQWAIWSTSEGIVSKAMDDLLNYVGWKKMKIIALEIFKMALAWKKMPADAQKENMPSLNYCFLGNPGTGKTTAARLFAEILYDCGLREKPTFIETSAQDLMNAGLNDFKNKLESAKGGTVFIDEAYDLDPAGRDSGKPFVSELLSTSEKNRNNLSIFLAGYEDDIANKLFAYNDGLKSRFKCIIFDDFDHNELLQIWNFELNRKKWTADENAGQVLIRKISKLSNRKGFGNARIVRQKVEDSVSRACARDDFNGNMKLILEDVVGVNPIKNIKVQNILQEIDQMIGWEGIKKSVKEIVTVSSKNYSLELAGMPTLPLSLNRLFLGNPGTGKSKCSQFYGRLLKHLNFLSVGEVLWKTASDFVGQYVGESQKKTNAIIANARGKVLVIDEAYALDDKLFGKQVLDVLVEKVQGTEADDIAVILIGYDQQMSQMLRNQNPGLTRRFPRESAFVFEDFCDEELLRIWDKLCSEKNVECSYHVGSKVISILSQKRNFPHFGNAGTVTTLFNSALSKASLRIQEQDTNTSIRIDPQDLEDIIPNGDPFEPLSKLFRMESIVEELKKLKKTHEIAKMDGSELPTIGHFVFRGSPGTGKTTVARVMAQILYQLNLLNYNKVVETTGRDLTGEYLGQTKVKVHEKLKDAQGGILFIDEAYSLGKDSFGSEAVDTIVAALTSNDYKGLILILAGYPSEMDRMFDFNAGLKSRFTKFITFEDWNVSDCLQFIETRSNQDNFQLQNGVLEVLKMGFSDIIKLPGWGNGRDVNQVWQMLLENRSSRIYGAKFDGQKEISVSDAEITMSTMIKERKPHISNIKKTDEFLGNSCVRMMDNGLQQFMADSSNKENTDVKEMNEICQKDQLQKDHAITLLDGTEIETSSCVDEIEDQEISTMPEIRNFIMTCAIDVERDSGVSDEVWNELQTAKQMYSASLSKLISDLESKTKDPDVKDCLKKESNTIVQIQKKLKKISICPLGYAWIKCSNGWRCAGGSHYVSNAQLQEKF